jgi:hypothetical protein
VICGATGRNGKAPHKYCDQHIEEGILAQHIKSKRVRTASPASTSTQRQSSLPDGWKLLSIESIIDCRHVPRRPNNAPPPCVRPGKRAARGRGPCTARSAPARPLTARPHVRGRCCKPDELDEVDAENGLEDEEMISSIEYLVLGHFERRDGDKKGRDAMVWLSPTDFEESRVAAAAVDAKLDEWERESARRRKEARKRAREGA